MAVDLPPQSAPDGDFCSMRTILHAAEEGCGRMESVSGVLRIHIAYADHPQSNLGSCEPLTLSALDWLWLELPA